MRWLVAALAILLAGCGYAYRADSTGYVEHRTLALHAVVRAGAAGGEDGRESQDLRTGLLAAGRAADREPQMPLTAARA